MMPERTLTDADLDLLTGKFKEAQSEHCRYPFEPEELINIIQFVRDIMYVHHDTKRIIRRWLTVFMLGAIVTTTAAGIWMKFKASITAIASGVVK